MTQKKQPTTVNLTKTIELQPPTPSNMQPATANHHHRRKIKNKKKNPTKLQPPWPIPKSTKTHEPTIAHHHDPPNQNTRETNERERDKPEKAGAKGLERGRKKEIQWEEGKREPVRRKKKEREAGDIKQRGKRDLWKKKKKDREDSEKERSNKFFL